MAPKVLIKRTSTANSPPTGLSPGELAIEMSNPTRLWVGVPIAIDGTGRKLLFDNSVAPPVSDFYSKSESDSRFVNAAGDSMSGALAIAMNSPAFSLVKPVGAYENLILGNTDAGGRWQIRLGDAAAETGGSAGSNFSISRVSDAGVMSTALSINRATGITDFFAVPTVGGVPTFVTRFNTYQIPVSQQYVPPAGLRWVIVELVGAGAGGGGIFSNGADYVAAGGGGAGAYARSILSAAQVGSSQYITIGAPGAGNVPGNIDGGAGGASSFGSLVIAVGGTATSTSGAVRQGGMGGEGINCTGNVRITGGGGAGGFISIGNVNVGSRGGAGGNSFFGCGAASPSAGGLGSSGYGGGGSGGCGTTAVGGGQGGQGLCQVTEIF
jgi:hypothetical protein